MPSQEAIGSMTQNEVGCHMQREVITFGYEGG